MEQAESEDALVIYKKNIDELLDTMVLMGNKLEERSERIINGIKNEDNNLEAAGVRLMKLCICMKGNLENIAKSLQKNINEVNQNRGEKLFSETLTKILEYKTCVFVTSEKNKCIQTSPLSKSTQTDIFDNSVLNNSIHLANKNDNSEPDIESNLQQLNSNHENNNLIPLQELDKHKQNVSLSLRRTETQDFETQDTQDDIWIDSLKRNLPVTDLLNRQCNGDKISVTDELLDHLKKEHEEEDILLRSIAKSEEDAQWDVETEEMKCDVKAELSTTDDIFVEVKEEVSSVVIEEHNLSDLDAVLDSTSNLNSKPSDGEEEIDENVVSISETGNNCSDIDVETENTIKNICSPTIEDAVSNNEQIKPKHWEVDDELKASNSKEIVSHTSDEMISTSDEPIRPQLSELSKINEIENIDICVEADTVDTNNSTNKSTCEDIDNQIDTESENTMSSMDKEGSCEHSDGGPFSIETDKAMSTNDETSRQFSETSKIDEIDNSYVCEEAEALCSSMSTNNLACNDVNKQAESANSDIDENEDSYSETLYRDPFSVETVKQHYDSEGTQISDNSDCESIEATQAISSTTLGCTEKEIDPHEEINVVCNDMEEEESEKTKSNSITGLSLVTENQNSTNEDLEQDVENIQINAEIDKVPLQSEIINSVVEKSPNKSALEDTSNVDNLPNMISEQSDCVQSQTSLPPDSSDKELESNKEDTSQSVEMSAPSIGQTNSSFSLNLNDNHLELPKSQEEKINAISDTCQDLIREKELVSSDNDSDATLIDDDSPTETVENNLVVNDKVFSDSDETILDLDYWNKQKDVSSDKICTETYTDKDGPGKICPVVDQSEKIEAASQAHNSKSPEEDDLKGDIHSDSTDIDDEVEPSKECAVLNSIDAHSEKNEIVEDGSTETSKDNGQLKKMSISSDTTVDSIKNTETVAQAEEPSLAEDGLSQSSCKSFQFDISENFNHIGTNITDLLQNFNVNQASGDNNTNSVNSKEVPPSSKAMIDNNKNLDAINSPTNREDSIVCQENIENDKQFKECLETDMISDSSDNTNNIDDAVVNESDIKKPALPGSEQPISESNRELENIDGTKVNESDVTKPASPISEQRISESNAESESIADSTVKRKCDQEIENIVEDLEELLSDKKEQEELDVKETVEILDSDDEVHLDVIMEEILTHGSSFPGSDIEEIVPTEINEEENAADYSKVKQEKVEEGEKGENNGERLDESCVGDELLELLREVQVPASTLPSAPETLKNQHNSGNSEDEAKEADRIFKQLEEESSFDFSDSDLSDNGTDSSLSLLELLENGNNDEQITAGINNKLLKFTDELLVENDNWRECFVKLERLDLNDRDVIKVDKSLNDSIDRLCDLSNILKKRKYTADSPQEKSNQKRSKKVHRKATSEFGSSCSDITTSDSDSEQRAQTYSPILSTPMENRLDDMLANEIINVLKSEENIDTSDDESVDSCKSSKKTKIEGSNGEAKQTEKLQKKLSREERLKKSWRNDPLLRGKLTTDSESNDSSTTDGNKSSKRKKTRKSRYLSDSEYIIQSDSVSSDSDLAGNKLSLDAKVISPIKRNIPISDSSDTDSEIEFVPQQQKTPQKSEGDEAIPSSQRGRRNIRALMSDENLAEATRKANQEEQLRIQRLQEREKNKESLSLSQSFSECLEENDLVLDFKGDSGETLLKVHPRLCSRLKPHQRIGIQFMWDSCYESLERLKDDEGSGCILAHCMGLGKTLQVLALIHTLFSNEATNTKRILVVCPLSTVNNWKNEVKLAFKSMPHEKIKMLTIAHKKEISNKYEIVREWYLRKKCVLVLGYEGFETLTNETKLEKCGQNHKDRMLEALVDPGPDLVICDEGHLLRNKKALKTMALNSIKTKRRIVLTGTPLQNNLLEYYHMVQFVKPNLLGNTQEFKTNFVNPITNGQYEDSTAEDIKLMMKRTHVLHKLLKKTIQRIEDTELKMYLPAMKDHAVFIQLHQVQVDLYNQFSEIACRNNANPNKKGFLSDFSVFQYIGTHPQLLAVVDKMKHKRIKERDLITNKEDNHVCDMDGWWKTTVPNDAAEQINYGNKLVVVRSIIEECEEINDKVLIFSQSLGELDLIEHFLKKVGTARCPSWQKKVDYDRMDGTVIPEQRTTICDSFNDKKKKKLRLLLMSTKVGGLGLNLTAANRVIIMTVNWNPSYDTQSVFRVYRFGQEKSVFVYRLISLDTMEEKVYQRTVTKLAIAHRVIDKHQVTRHYKSVDLQELYSCKPNADQERPTPIVPEDQVLAKLILKLPFIFKYHEHRALLVDRPEDNLNEIELSAAWDEFKRIKDAPKVPPQPVVPQLPTPTGPTFSMAYNLCRPNLPSPANVQGASNKDIPLYYVPNQNSSTLNQKTNLPVPNMRNGFKAYSNIVNTLKTVTGNFSNTLSKLPNVTSESIVAKDCKRKYKRINPLAQSDKVQDPLYIPLNTAKADHSYNRVLSLNGKKYLPVPKVPLSLTDSSEQSNQKKNMSRRNNVRKENLPENGSIVILDDDHDLNRLKKHEGSIPESCSKLKPTASASNRKRKAEKASDQENQLDVVIKKMRDAFNTSIDPINLDDDDDDSVITDTTSETSSLSSEMIRNLGLSGITIHKVMKECNDVINLD